MYSYSGIPASKNCGQVNIKLGKEKKKSMKCVITKALEYHSILEELPINMDKRYLCRVVIDSDYGQFRVYYRVMSYYGEGKWDTTKGIVTHWAEIPEVYDIDDNKIL